MNNVGLQQEMTSEGIVHAGKFTDEKIAQNLQRFYQSL
jgi:hypothetical protein